MRYRSFRNLPNFLSFFRLVLSPLMLFVPSPHLPGFFLLLALSDALDGFLARRLRAQTELGKVLDPLADKVMLLCGMFICVYRFEAMSEWLLYLSLLRDFSLVLGAGLITLRRGAVPSARALGKAYTFFLSLFVALCLWGFSVGELQWLALLLLSISWMDYAWTALKVFRSQTSSLLLP
ncbi:MAG: CDP-alcohol phosphatidyltransferase family protein [Aquificaceae bacterium]|nr:CDP-alcohol phosphatidyltransferase family protein [Aquificaceae bacterium]